MLGVARVGGAQVVVIARAVIRRAHDGLARFITVLHRAGEPVIRLWGSGRGAAADGGIARLWTVAEHTIAALHRAAEALALDVALFEECAAVSVVACDPGEPG